MINYLFIPRRLKGIRDACDQFGDVRMGMCTCLSLLVLVYSLSTILVSGDRLLSVNRAEVISVRERDERFSWRSLEWRLIKISYSR
jgi:hypothetical protein